MQEIKTILTLSYFHMRSRYRKTLAGFIWVIANPIINFTVQAIVFKTILKIQIQNYPAFLLSGLLPWFFISQTITSLAGALVNARELLLSFKIKPSTIVGSQVVDNFFNYICASLLLMIILMISGLMKLNAMGLFLFIPNSILLFAFVFNISTMISFLHVFFRDIQFVAGFVMNLAFFITPIFYKREFLSPSYQWIVDYNLFYPFIEVFNFTLHQLNYGEWFLAFLKCLLINVIVYLLLKLMVKYKMKDFYINV